MFFHFVNLTLQLIFFHDPVGSLFLNCKDQSCPLLLSFFSLFLTIIESEFEGLTFAINLLLVLSNTAIALVLNFLELKSKFFLVLLLLSESLLERSDLFIAILSSVSQALSDVMQLLLKAFDFVLRLQAHRLVRFHDLLDLVLVLVLHCFDDSVRVALRLFFALVASLLELLQSDFKLALRVKQVALVVVFLGL